VSNKLTDNFSISKAHQWVNRDDSLGIFNLPEFSERTLYRVLETLGNNRETIISDIQNRLFARYDF
jgi:transposase